MWAKTQRGNSFIHGDGTGPNPDALPGFQIIIKPSQKVGHKFVISKLPCTKEAYDTAGQNDFFLRPVGTAPYGVIGFWNFFLHGSQHVGSGRLTKFSMNGK